MQKRKVSGYKEQDTRQTLLEVVKTLRANPDQYEKMRRALKKARTDNERVEKLLKFATSERDLAALIPAKTGGVATAAWTTVTVTTVLVLVSTAE